MTIQRASSSLKGPAPQASEESVPSPTEFRMPAEWEPHEATWLAWPHELSDWPGKFAPIPWAFAEIVRHLALVERVFLIVENRAEESRVRKTLVKAGVALEAITFFHIPTDRGWMRDSGPIGVAAGETGGLALVHFAFNGWAKYGNHKKDALLAVRANRLLELPLITPERNGQRVVLEGGAIDVNGSGTLLTTEECLLSDAQSRNPGFTKEDYQEIFRRYLGATNVLWLRSGIAGDDTHGHVDDLARFVDPRTVVTVVEQDRSSLNYDPLQENLQLLRGMKDTDGWPLRVETLPMPKPVYFAKQLLPASYANFYIANQIVLVPVFNDPADRLALNILASLFPDREIAPIYCRDLVLGLGTIHCMTQQLPRLG